MEEEQLSQQRPEGDSKRLGYKSPTLRQLGKLTHVTLGAPGGTKSGDGMPGTDKTG
jgi:hypothetical protein